MAAKTNNKKVEQRIEYISGNMYTELEKFNKYLQDDEDGWVVKQISSTHLSAVPMLFVLCERTISNK